MVGALIGAGASVFGNLLGQDLQSNANAQNMRIAQMNNEWNYKMFKEQQQYNLDMWNRANEYNTPLAQAERLRAAGLNPAQLMSGSNSGTAGSAGGVTPPTASPVQVQSFKPDFSGVSSSLIASQQLQNQKEQLRIETLKGIGEFLDHVESSRSKAVQSEGQKILNQYLRSSEELRLQGMERNNEYIKAQREVAVNQANLFGVQKLIADKHLGYMDEMKQYEMAEILSRVALNLGSLQLQDSQRALNYANVALTNENKKKVSQEIINLAETEYGIKLNNSQALMLTPYVLRSARISADYPLNDWYYMYNDPSAYGVHSVGNIFSGSFNVSKKVGK